MALGSLCLIHLWSRAGWEVVSGMREREQSQDAMMHNAPCALISDDTQTRLTRHKAQPLHYSHAPRALSISALARSASYLCTAFVRVSFRASEDSSCCSSVSLSMADTSLLCVQEMCERVMDSGEREVKRN